jgi:hypothetical protein
VEIVGSALTARREKAAFVRKRLPRATFNGLVIV